MKYYKPFIPLLILSLLLLCGGISAQKNVQLSTFYKYAWRLELSKRSFPYGFGSSVSIDLPGKLKWSSGLEYSHLYDETQMRIIDYRTDEIYKETVTTFFSGLSYPLTGNKICLSLEADLLISNFHTDFKFSRYKIATDVMDLHFRIKDDYQAFGIRCKLNLELDLSDHFGILIQPGISKYLAGEQKNSFFEGCAGATIKF